MSEGELLRNQLVEAIVAARHGSLAMDYDREIADSLLSRFDVRLREPEPRLHRNGRPVGYYESP